LSESFSDKTHQRLKALVTAKNGFELSEMDLALRGAGELGGGKQWGISDIGMEAIKNIKMVEAAREEAKKLLADDPDLSGHTQLQVALTHRAQSHFE
jgi:ATP-dependent DNA helicase RecG